MFEQGEKLWLALCFYRLPLEALLSTRPLGASGSNNTEALSHPFLDEQPLRANASENAEALDYLSFAERPLGASGSNNTEALSHLPFDQIDQKPLDSTAGVDGTEGRVHWECSESTSKPSTPIEVEPGQDVPGTAPHRAQRPAAVLEKQRVLVCNEAAAALGIKAGMGTATTRALADSILLLERDRGAEQRRLRELCCWGYSVSPTLYTYHEDCLLLEVGSCLKLYGGLEALLALIERGLARRGAQYRVGLGPTPKSAVLFSIGPLGASAAESGSEAPDHCLNSDSGSSLASDGLSGTPFPRSEHEAESLEARLAPLPLKLLADFPRQVDALAKAGLWTFGDILALPRQALGRRCGREFLHHLEQILGTAEDRQPVFEPPQAFSDDYWFGYEVKANQELLPAIELLLQAFCRFLRNTQLETQQVEWLLYGINRKIHRFEVCSSQPQTHWQAWYQLTRLKVEQLELDQSIEGVGLASEQLVPGNASSDDLFQQAGQREPPHSLLDRLKSRLGLQSVSKLGSRDEHLPEFAGYCSLDTRPGSVPCENGELRPFWLMQEPQQLEVFNGQPCWQGCLDLLDGPERIEDNWWECPVSRDYYVARDSAGLLYWVFRDRLREGWYMQGVFL